MEVGDFLDDCESEPEAADLLAVLLGGEVGVEDAFAVFRADAGTLVGDQQLDAPAPARHSRDSDRHAGGRGIEGVVHEVHQCSFEENGVTRQRGARDNLGGDVDPEAAGAGRGVIPDAAQKGLEFNFFHFWTEVLPKNSASRT